MSYVRVEGQALQKEQNGDMMVDIYSAYGSQKSVIQYGADSVQSKNFYDALGQTKRPVTSTEPIYSGTNKIESDESNFKLILQKRKMEEAKSGKCRVVIKDTVSVAETKTEKLNDSKALLQKIANILTKEDYQTFKVALSNFYTAKKNSDNEKKIKYYKILRSLFSKDLEFFAEIEKFIQFTGVIKDKQQEIEKKVTNLKRKIDDCN